MEVFMEMKDIYIEGNIIDNGWIENLKYENGKPNFNAILILSEIVYWYRPIEVRNEATGKVKGYTKKFKADKLQKTYQNFADHFGISKRQAKDACDFLKEKGIITVEFRNIVVGTMGFLSNVMYIEPVIENLKKITGINRVVEVEESPNDEIVLSLAPPTSKRTTPIHSNVPPSTADVDTYTEITTEITTENNISVCQSQTPKTDPKKTDGPTDNYHDVENYFKELIGYKQLECYGKGLVDEIMLAILDMWYSKYTTVNKEMKPQVIVRGVIGKLDYWKVDNVISSYKAVTKEIKNIKGYLQSSLYNSVFEFNTGRENFRNRDNDKEDD